MGGEQGVRGKKEGLEPLKEIWVLENIVPATIDERDKGKREKKGVRGRDKDE